MIFPNDEYYYADIVGGKTGYTDASRHTLVSYAVRGGKRLIAVIMQGEKNVPYTDSITLFDYGFSIYHDVKVLDKNDYQTKTTIRIGDDQMQALTLVPRANLTLSLPETVAAAEIEKDPVFETAARYGFEKGDRYGMLKLSYHGVPLGEAALVVAEADTKPAPQTPRQNTESRPVFNDMQADAPQSGGLPYIPVLLSAAALGAAAFAYHRARGLRKRRMSRRRLRTVGNKGYRYRDELHREREQ
jgi:D-alanyl-D-alanine carboxypeptidase